MEVILSIVIKFIQSFKNIFSLVEITPFFWYNIAYQFWLSPLGVYIYTIFHHDNC